MTLLTLLNQAGPPPPARNASGGGTLTLMGGGTVSTIAAPSLPGALQRLRRRQAAFGPKVHRPWRRAPNTAQGGGVLELLGGGTLSIPTRARGGGVLGLRGGAAAALGDNPEELAVLFLISA